MLSQTISSHRFTYPAVSEIRRGPEGLRTARPARPAGPGGRHGAAVRADRAAGGPGAR
jgi:hypothetical protein